MKALKFAALAAVMALAPANTGNWNLTVEETKVSHTIGNPDAAVKLTEYVSYTCGTCERFAREGDPNLELLYINTGKVSVEIKHLLRDPIDLTVAMLTRCGDPSKFKQNHAAFMLTREKWFKPAINASQTQISRWTQRGAAARRNIANDFGFYDIMERRGYRVTDTDRCLNDEKLAEALAAATQSYVETYGNHGTPMFTINGARAEVAPAWSALKPALDAAIAKAEES